MVFTDNRKVRGPLLQVLLVATLFGVSGCGKQESAHALLEQAKANHQKGDNKAAIIQLKSALQINPTSGEARYTLGTVYNDIGDYPAAEEELRRALQLGAEKGKARVALGQALLRQGEYQKVLDEIRSSPALQGDAAAGVLTQRANAYLALGKIDNAKSALEEALRQQPDYADAYLGEARLAMAQKDAEGALRQVNIVLEKAPRNTEGWLMKGDVLRMQAKPQDAIAAYQQALKIDANNVPALLALASMHLAANQIDAARKETDAARKVAPNNVLARYMTALLDFRQAKYTEARDELQQVLRGAPNHMPSVLLSGATAYALGTYEQAEADLNKFLHRYPGSAYARKLLAATWLKKGQAERALDVLKPALTKDTRDPQLLVLAGDICMAMKEYGQATEYLEKALALDPKDSAVRTTLGVSQLAKGDTERAVAELESAAALGPGQYEADTILIVNYLRAKEYDKALRAIAALERKQPKNPLTYNLKGGAYLGKGDLASARTSFEKALVLQPTYIDAATNLAQLDIKDKHPDAARQRFEKILVNDRNNVDAMVALANFAASRGQDQEYVGWLEKAVKADPSALRPLSLLANYYVQKQQPEKALGLAHQAQTANQGNPDALDLLGSVQSAAGEKDNAVATYTKLVAITPKSPQSHFKLAAAQTATQHLEAAEASLNKALELKPDYLDAQVVLVSLEMRAGRGANALKIAQQVQKQHPEISAGFALEGNVLLAQKQYGQAVKAYEKAFNVSKNGTIAIKLHQAQTLAGNVKDADTQMLQWLKEQPKDLAARGYLAQAYMTRGETGPAIEQYQLLLHDQPVNTLALNNLAWLYHGAKDPRALDVAEQAYKLQPDAAFIADTLGWILLEQGNTARGVEILRKAVALAPKNSEIGYHYAVALFKSGDKQQARKQLEAVLHFGQNFPQQAEAMALLKQL